MDLPVENISALRYRFHPVPSFGKNLARLRVRAGLNGKQLAAKLGVKPPYVTGLEKDYQGLPETSTLLRLAKALRCRVDELLDGVDDEYEAVKRDLARHDGDQRSDPSEGRVDVPASPVIEARRVESVSEELRTAATEIAARLVGIAGRLSSTPAARSDSSAESRASRRRRTGS
jgi:transcriptional regulator with XRE-family HTH domain